MRDASKTLTDRTDRTDRITLTAAEFWHDTPSANRMIITWLLKIYLSIIAACGIPALLFVLVPRELLIAPAGQIDAQLYLFPIAIITLFIIHFCKN